MEPELSPKSLSCLDAEGFDIGPLVEAAAQKHGIPLIGLLGMLKAESGLNPKAARYGAFPDISFGMSQVSVPTAAGYGVGDGFNTPENIALVRDYLFDRWQSINLGAVHLSGCYGQADAAGYEGEQRTLQALIVYNSGAPQPKGNWYWKRWPANIAGYEAAILWAASIVDV